ncbi:MAG: arginyltransferase [Proteobacteria bacterium]|nr:arginyltransferase [Pseudomonadota bacterium]MDA1132712.1 arginyltransferase [Pseudomonadota bacterium]
MTAADRTIHRFFATPKAPCPYLPERTERKLFTPLVGGEASHLHDLLSASGFRRSQSIVYKPACEGCRSCIPVRVRTGDFIETRSLRRIERRNNDLVVTEQPPLATPEQFLLFRDYQRYRHALSGMADMDFGDYQDMVEDTTVETALIEFRDKGGTLRAACLTDRMADGFSLCYSFFDPEAAYRSLGTQIVLWHIRKAQRIGLPYVYLGYWIAESPKMSYKTRFQPLEGLLLALQGWRDLSEIAPGPISGCATGAATRSAARPR